MPEEFKQRPAQFWNDTSGSILPYVTLMLVVIMGVSVLALEGARFTGLNTQLQNGADALALAGAAELNGLPDAITRADTAISNLASNSTLAGTAGGAQQVTVSCKQYVTALPVSDATAIACPNGANSTTNGVDG
jgi:Flp pilus assembly protein TadG